MIGHFFRRLLAAMQIRRAAKGATVCIEQVSGFKCPAAAFQRDALAVIGEVIVALNGRDARLREHLRIARCIDDHAALIEFSPRFAVDDESFAVSVRHHRLGNQRVVENIHAVFAQKPKQLQRKQTGGKPADASLVRRLCRFTLLPFLRQRVKAQTQGQFQKLLCHAADNHPSPSVAQRHPEIDQPCGSQPAQAALLLDEQNTFAAAPGRKRGGSAAQPAARDQHVIAPRSGQRFLQMHRHPRIFPHHSSTS